MPEAIYYIAEIISRFDIVAIQEVYKDLSGLNRLMKILGGNWKYVFTDVTEGDRGNDERLAFVYDRRKLRFSGLAGELVLEPIKTSKKTYVPVSQFWRTPFVCGFTSGWTRFMLATVHIVWGEDSASPQIRIDEINNVAKVLKKRIDDETAWARNLILLGDFNIFKPKDPTFNALVDSGFRIPKILQDEASNISKKRHFDQIAFMSRKDSLEWTGRAGVFDFYQYVFRDEDEKIYIPQMMPRYEMTKKRKVRSDVEKKKYYKTWWRTHQISDHFPKWIELKIDYSDGYLNWKLNL